MKILKSIFFICIAGLFFALTFSCEKIEPPYVKKGYDTVIYPEYPKKILVEDYTAHMCTYCPDGHHALEAMMEKYHKPYYDGYIIIPMAIHVSSLAFPAPPQFPTDFRTEEGEELDAHFGASSMGLPKGLVNRVEYESNLILSPDSWGDAAAVLLEDNQAAIKMTIKQADIYLFIVNEYDTTSRVLNCSIDAMFLSSWNNPVTLAVFLVEDGIISGQLNHGTIDPNYVHNHVLRDGISGVWGDAITTAAAAQGETKNKNYTYTLPANFIYSNCSVLAYVYDSSTGEVIQAEIKKLVE
jgi:hypothetical protein